MKTHVLVRTVLLSVCVLAVTGAVVAYLLVTHSSPTQGEPMPAIPRVLAPPLAPVSDYTVRVVGYGSARPKVEVAITPEVSGKVVRKADSFLPGKYVQAGQMLLEIEKTDFQQAADAAGRQIELLDARLRHLDQEEANLKATAKFEQERLVLAERLHQRNIMLMKRGAGTESEVDAAMEQMLARQEQLQNIRNTLALIGPSRDQLRAEKRIAEVEKAKAETAMRRATITAPISGRVLSESVEVGDRLQAGTAYARVYGAEVMEVEVPIPAGELAWLDPAAVEAAKREENPIRSVRPIEAVVSWQEPGTQRVFHWPGHVERVRAGLEERTRAAAVVVQVHNPLPEAERGSTDRPALEVNMFCQVELRGRTVAEAFLLPRRAIREGSRVLLANEGRLSSRPVTVARYSDETALILPGGGLLPGDRVVIGYVPKAVLGMEVEPIDALPAPVPTGEEGG